MSAVFSLPAAGANDRSGGSAPAPGFAVFVANGGRVRQVPVVLGTRNGSEAWIRCGVKPGQQVIVYPPAAVRDGVRIAMRKV